MAHEAAALNVGACNALIDNLLVADSPDGASLEMRAKSTSYRGPRQAAQRNDALMRAQVSTAIDDSSVRLQSSTVFSARYTGHCCPCLGGTILYYPMPKLEGADALRFLLEEHDLTQSDLPEVGSQGVVSEILGGKRTLNVRQIRALSERFGVSPAVFV